MTARNQRQMSVFGGRGETRPTTDGSYVNSGEQTQVCRPRDSTRCS